jgi:nitrate/TMAO reductase-like tetraheme cytochrome c subunit
MPSASRGGFVTDFPQTNYRRVNAVPSQPCASCHAHMDPRRAAEALREAAVSMDRKGHPYCPCSRRLRDRADTLDGKP